MRISDWSSDVCSSDLSGRLRNPRTDERQHLPLRRLFEHRGSDRGSRGREGVKPFNYERAHAPADAARIVASTPGARFIAGGTNLLDLMKLQIETQAHLADINGLDVDKMADTQIGSAHV